MISANLNAKNEKSRPSRSVAFLAAGSLLVLAGCSSTSAAPGATGTTGAAGSCASAKSKLNLAFVYASTDLNPFQEMALGAKQAADEDGNVNLSEVAPTSIDGPKEVAMFQAAVRSSSDGVAYQTVTPDLFVRALGDAADAKVPVVAVDAAPPKGTAVTTFVGNSNTDLGILLGEAFVAQNPKADGEVVLGNDIPSLPLLVQRLDGVQSVLKNKLPGMKVSGPLDSKGTVTENYNAWKGIVASHQDATAFIGVGGQDGVNLPLIQKQTGKTFLAGSADLPPDAMQAVKSGALFALSSPEHWMKGYIAMHLLIESKRKCSALPTGWWNSGNLLVDKTNVDEIITRQATPESRAVWFKKVIATQVANPPVKPLTQAN